MEPITIRQKKVLSQFPLMVGIFFIALGFNTLDQMIIRYKWYDDWRLKVTWEMCYWLKMNWWDAYIMAVLMLVFGGALVSWYIIRSWNKWV